MRRATASLLFAALGAVAAPFARAEDEPAEAIRTALTEAAKAKDAPAQVQKLLEKADALVGPGASFPTRGDLAEWLGSMPQSVTAMPVVAVRRAWLYLASKRGADAIPLLDAALAREPKNAFLRAYLGDAKRQTGDVEGAIASWLAALDDGATDEQVLPSVRKLVYDTHETRGRDPADGLPRYATVASSILAKRAMPDVSEAIADWLFFDAGKARPDRKRVALLHAQAVRATGDAVRTLVAFADRPRLAKKAYHAARALETLGVATPDLPVRFDLLAAAVRLGERTGGDGHDVPEALAALAEEALAKGRYVLAAHMARRRLAISDSPTARRVLMSLPPDVGD